MSIHKEHDAFEKEVNAWLNQQGFITADLTYHNKLHPYVVNMLQNVYLPTTLCIRTRADRFAMKENPPICFEYEVKTRFKKEIKTSFGENNCDFLIEFLPFMAHFLESKLDKKCLYICKLNDIEKGFWSNDLGVISEVRIPNRFWDFHNGYFIKLVRNFTGQEPIRCNSKGSGDPFSVIARNIFEGFIDWKDIVKGLQNGREKGL